MTCLLDTTTDETEAPVHIVGVLIHRSLDISFLQLGSELNRLPKSVWRDGNATAAVCSLSHVAIANTWGVGSGGVNDDLASTLAFLK